MFIVNTNIHVRAIVSLAFMFQASLRYFEWLTQRFSRVLKAVVAFAVSYLLLLLFVSGDASSSRFELHPDEALIDLSSAENMIVAVSSEGRVFTSPAKCVDSCISIMYLRSLFKCLFAVIHARLRETCVPQQSLGSCSRAAPIPEMYKDKLTLCL